MKWSRSHAIPAAAHAALDCLTSIHLRVSALRRRLRRGDPAAQAEAFDHLDAIERDADEAAAQIERLVEGLVGRAGR